MREVLEKSDFDNTTSRLDKGGLLFPIPERFRNVDVHPDRIDNPTMGTVFEELIRRFGEALNENPGEHFTPRVRALQVEIRKLLGGLPHRPVQDRDEFERLPDAAATAAGGKGADIRGIDSDTVRMPVEVTGGQSARK